MNEEKKTTHTFDEMRNACDNFLGICLISNEFERKFASKISDKIFGICSKSHSFGSSLLAFRSKVKLSYEMIEISA